MTKKQALQLFEQKRVRTIWDEEQEKWYFAVVDVVMKNGELPEGQRQI